MSALEGSGISMAPVIDKRVTAEIEGDSSSFS